MKTIDYAIVTYGREGLERVAAMLPGQTRGVRYVVSWQNYDTLHLPFRLSQPDVLVTRTASRGISLNRNNALSHCEADIVVFADDDLTLYPQAPEIIRQAYSRHPQADVITFRSDHGDMARFPAEETVLGRKLPKGYSVASFEITMSREASRRLRCCPELGVGAPRIHGGEDELILWTAIRNGMDVRFIPQTICAHPHPSTGTKGTVSPGNLRGYGCVVAMMYPYTAILRVPLKIWRTWRAGKCGLGDAVRYTLAGALAAPGIYRRYRDLFRFHPLRQV